MLVGMHTRKVLYLALLVGLPHTGCPQGRITLDNLSNTSTNISATANGLFWLAAGGTPTLIIQDFNAAFYAGTDSSSLSPLATFLLSDGTAAGDNSGGPGTFADPTGKEYTVGFSSAFFQIQAWTGNFNSYASAIIGGAATAQSSVFSNPLGIPPAAAAELFNCPLWFLLFRSQACLNC